MKRARLSGVLAKVAKRSSASRCGENIRCPRATSWRIAAGQVGGRGRNAASGRGVAIAGPSPTLPAFSFFSSSSSPLFLPPPMDLIGGGAGDRRDTRVTGSVRPALQPGPSPPRPAGAFLPLSFQWPALAAPRAERTHRRTDFRPDAGASQTYVTSAGTYIPPAPLVPSLRVKRARNVCRTYTYCLLVTETDSPRGAEPSEKSAS